MRPQAGASRREAQILRMRRDSVLQRCLAVLLNQVTHASRYGEELALSGMGTFTAVPRITLYAADLQEKRHLLRLRLGKCFKPFSVCMVDKDICGIPEAMTSPTRHVTENLEFQLEAAALFEVGTAVGRRVQISRELSALPAVPALPAVHGLGTGSKILCDIICLDFLHVCSVERVRWRAHGEQTRHGCEPLRACTHCFLGVTQVLTFLCRSVRFLSASTLTCADYCTVPQNFKLGILRTVGALIAKLLDAICKRGYALYWSVDNTLSAINEHLMYFGRRSLASLAPTGCVSECYGCCDWLYFSGGACMTSSLVHPAH